MCDVSWLQNLALGNLAQRVEDEVRASRRRVEDHQKHQRKTRVAIRAAEKAAPELADGEGLAVEEEPAGAEPLMSEQWAAEEPDADDEPVHHRVFFPNPDDVASELAFPENTELVESCTQVLAGCGDSQAAAPDLAALSRELVLSGAVLQYYARRSSCPEAVVRQLFQGAALSLDERLASACFAALMALLGVDQDGLPAAALPHVSVLHAEEPSQCFLGWLPDSGDYLDALEAQGYNGVADDAALPADEQACAEPVLAARLHNLALALRLLPATLAAAEAGKGIYSLPSKDALPDLLLAILRLRLDPLACSLANNLEAGANAVIAAIGETQWERGFARLAISVAQLGASHRGHLEAIKRIPAGSARGQLLQQHALAAFLHRVIPGTKGLEKAKKRAAAVAPVDVPQVMRSLPWFSSSKGVSGLAEGAMAPGSPYTHAEVHSALQAAHLLEWEHERTHGRDEFVKRDWLGFLSGLEAQFLKHKTGELAGIKLLITTLLNFPAAQQGP